MLVPAMLLVVMVLGGIAVDMAVAFSAQRNVYRTISAASDDAAGMVDGTLHQIDGTVQLDQAAAERVVQAHLGVLRENLGDGAGESDLPFEVTESSVSTTSDSVTVSVTVRVDHIFLRAVPGAPDDSYVTVVSTGRFSR